MTDATLLTDILKADEANIPISIDLLKKHGIYDLYEKAIPHLFGALLPALQVTTPIGYFPFTRKTDAGLEIPAYDFVLRLFMLQSAREQFVFAAGHLLRGHLSQIPGHLRRAIEGAGIAYLSKSKPELGEIFMSGDAKKLRNATGTKMILPADDPITAALIGSMEFANNLTHSNFISFANRAEHSMSMTGTKWSISIGLDVYRTDVGSFIRMSLWFLRVMERVLRVLAASFELPDCEWTKDLEKLQTHLNQLYKDLDAIANPLHESS